MKQQTRMTTFKPEVLIKILIIGSIIADALLLTLLGVYHALYNNAHTYTYLALGASALGYFSLCAFSLKMRRISAAAKLVILFYFIVAVSASLIAGFDSSISLLLYCFFILVGGVLLGSSYVVKTTALSVVALFILRVLAEIIPTYFPNNEASFGSIAAYSILFGIFALIGWLGTSQMERALVESLQAKAESIRQKELVAAALESEEYRRERFQIEELNKLHQFAELGQQTTLLLHDFANQLTNLSLEIDDNSAASRRQAQNTLKEINTIMQSVREKLQIDEYSIINIHKILSTIIKERKAKLGASRIKVTYVQETQLHRPVVCGDPLKLRQVFNILYDNAIQAYATIGDEVQKTITIRIRTDQERVYVHIEDNGSGIPSEQRKRLFYAPATTKVGGHGIGLYIAQRVLQQQFKGSLILDPGTTRTIFVVNLPRIS